MSAFGPSRNPSIPTRSAGGSSAGQVPRSGSGAVELALGVDQGGSGRIPAAFCGVVGVKATHGLVPSFGVGHIDHTIDHVTPHRARSPRRRPAPRGDRRGRLARPAVGARADHAGGYTSAAGLGVERDADRSRSRRALRRSTATPAVLEGLDRAVSALRDAGATVEHFSLPIWADGFATFQPLRRASDREHDPLRGCRLRASRLHRRRPPARVCGRASEPGRAASTPTSSAGCSRTASCTSGISTSASESSRISGC